MNQSMKRWRIFHFKKYFSNAETAIYYCFIRRFLFFLRVLSIHSGTGGLLSALVILKLAENEKNRTSLRPSIYNKSIKKKGFTGQLPDLLKSHRKPKAVPLGRDGAKY